MSSAGPLSSSEAKARVRTCLESGSVVLTRHFKEQIAKREITVVECMKALRGGIVRPAEFEHDAWRYPVETSSLCVIVEFLDADTLLITAWRKR